MQYLVECDCGWSCRGGEEEVVAACAAHPREVHGLDLSREQILAAAQRVEADDISAATKG
jgi:predicted small metal-binding protein